jgi:hypothetical protein
VKSDSPNNNYGAIDTLRTRGVVAPLYNTYLKFDLSGISGPIESARLRLFAYDGSPNGGSIYLVSNDYQGSSTPWTEAGLNWNNAPIIGGSPLSTYTANIPNNTWVEYDVTAAITGDGIISFAISSTTSNSLLFFSSEAVSNNPELVIETSGGEGFAISPDVISSAQAPDLVGSSQCVDGNLSYVITNQGGTMSEASAYSVFGPQGELPSATFGPLGTGESATISYSDVTPTGLYLLFVGLDGTTITADCAEPTATPTLTTAPTLTHTPTPTLTTAPTDIPTTTSTPLPTSTLVPFPTFTPTPLPIALPFFDNLDAGQAAWSVNGAWVVQNASLLNGTGQFWYVSSNDGSISTLNLSYGLDLRTAPHPMLRFDSLLVSTHSIANLEISADGVTWLPVLSVQPSTTLQPVLVDLSAFQQQVIWLRWVWLSQAPSNGQTPDFWVVDNMVVGDASLLQPTATFTPSAIPTLEPSATPSATAIATATLESTEDVIPNIDPPTEEALIEAETIVEPTLPAP